MLISILSNAYRSVRSACILAILLSTSIPSCLYSESCENDSQSPNEYEYFFTNNFDKTDDETDILDSVSECKKCKCLTYYLYIEDFANSFIEIPTSNVSNESTTISSKYLAGRASVYNKDNNKAGTCSASFLCMQNGDGIYTDISNYLSVNNGLIITWFTPTTLINLELDSIIHSMVTQCIVVAATNVGFNPFYGETFNLIVSSDDEKIYFNLFKN